MDLSQFWAGASDWHGQPFVLFGEVHLTAILIEVLLIVLMALFRNKISSRWDTFFRYLMATILIVNEILWHVWNISHGTWTIQTMLPLHVCSILVWANAYMLITRNRTIFEFAYLLGIATALQAFLTPDAGIFGFPHLRFFQVILSHGTIILSGFYMLFVGGLRPTWHSVKKVLLFGNLYALAVFVFNLLSGSNYMFLAHKLDTTSLLDLLPPWPIYLLYIEGLGIFFILLFFAPFVLYDWQQLHRKKAVE